MSQIYRDGRAQPQVIEDACDGDRIELDIEARHYFVREFPGHENAITY